MNTHFDSAPFAPSLRRHAFRAKSSTRLRHIISDTSPQFRLHEVGELGGFSHITRVANSHIDFS